MNVVFFSFIILWVSQSFARSFNTRFFCSDLGMCVKCERSSDIVSGPKMWREEVEESYQLAFHFTFFFLLAILTRLATNLMCLIAQIQLLFLCWDCFQSIKQFTLLIHELCDGWDSQFQTFHCFPLALNNKLFLSFILQFLRAFPDSIWV